MKSTAANAQYVPEGAPNVVTQISVADTTTSASLDVSRTLEMSAPPIHAVTSQRLASQCTRKDTLKRSENVNALGAHSKQAFIGSFANMESFGAVKGDSHPGGKLNVDVDAGKEANRGIVTKSMGIMVCQDAVI